MPFARSASRNERNQYFIALSVPLGCFSRTTHPICLLHTPWSTVPAPGERGRANTGSINFTLSFSKADFPSWAYLSEVFGWPSRSIPFSSALAKLKSKIKRQKMLHCPRNDRSSVNVVRCSRPCTVPIVPVDTAGRTTTSEVTMRTNNVRQKFAFLQIQYHARVV